MNTIKIYILNKQVELFHMRIVMKYDEELFTSFFDLTNKIEIEKIRIQLKFSKWSLSNEDVKNICAKIYKKIRSLETQSIISNKVSSFCLTFITKLLVFVCELKKLLPQTNFTFVLVSSNFRLKLKYNVDGK